MPVGSGRIGFIVEPKVDRGLKVGVGQGDSNERGGKCKEKKKTITKSSIGMTQ